MQEDPFTLCGLPFILFPNITCISPICFIKTSSHMPSQKTASRKISHDTNESPKKQEIYTLPFSFPRNPYHWNIFHILKVSMFEIESTVVPISNDQNMLFQVCGI